jgi:hypothetical protein
LNIIGQKGEVTIHEHGDKVDAHGQIEGVGFTYQITDATSGEITSSSEGSVAFVQFFVNVSGIVTFANGDKCRADAVLSGDGLASAGGIIPSGL